MQWAITGESMHGHSTQVRDALVGERRKGGKEERKERREGRKENGQTSKISPLLRMAWLIDNTLDC